MSTARTLRERPFLTGIMLGVVVALFGTGTDGTVALVAFVFGVVLAVFGERWYQPAGQALAAAGAVAILLQTVGEVFRELFVTLA